MCNEFLFERSHLGQEFDEILIFYSFSNSFKMKYVAINNLVFLVWNLPFVSLSADDI